MINPTDCRKDIESTDSILSYFSVPVNKKNRISKAQINLIYFCDSITSFPSSPLFVILLFLSRCKQKFKETFFPKQEEEQGERNKLNKKNSALLNLPSNIGQNEF